MPDLTFNVPASLQIYAGEGFALEPSESILVGRWRFFLSSKRATGNGYEVTYSNPFISQDETDRIMQKYREETSQR